ncbi:MAG: HlyC/CorC family transporter [Nevskiaceae bacterium]|nr:MAG: HlyC/CorC family transporter [Nevskiaceae bacterium]
MLLRHPMNLTENALLLLFALFLVLLNGFFVAAEFAIVKLRHTRVEELRKLHGFRGRILALVHQKLDAYLSACQLGITLASLGLGWVGEPAFASLLEAPLKLIGWDDDPEAIHGIAFVLAFGTISYLHIVLGELAPKSAALRKPEAMSLWTAVPLYVFYWCMFPFIWGLNASANWILRRAGLGEGGGHGHEVPYSHDELRMILHLSRAAADEEDTELNRMLAHTLELPTLHASDVMRNRRELVSIASNASHAEVQRALQLHRYSRYPYLDSETGEALGVLLLKDIYLEGPGPDYTSRLRDNLLPVERVREDTPVSELLRRFRLGATHLALVDDDAGRLVGFVTMEDVLEAVFGEITDEHEKERATQINREPQRLSDGSVLVRGDTPLFKLERELGEAIPESEALSTVTGLLMERLGQMPAVGDSIGIGEHTATVTKVRGTQIESVRVALAPTAMG